MDCLLFLTNTVYELWSVNKESKEDWRSERKQLTIDHFRVTLCICFKRSLELPCASLSKLDWSYLVPQFQKESRVTWCLCFKTRLELPCATVSKRVLSYPVPLFQNGSRVTLCLRFKTSLELTSDSVSKRVFLSNLHYENEYDLHTTKNVGEHIYIWMVWHEVSC